MLLSAAQDLLPFGMRAQGLVGTPYRQETKLAPSLQFFCFLTCLSTCRIGGRSLLSHPPSSPPPPPHKAQASAADASRPAIPDHFLGPFRFGGWWLLQRGQQGRSGV